MLCKSFPVVIKGSSHLEDWYVSQAAKRNRKSTPSQIPADLPITTGKHSSARSISHLLNKVGLYAWKPVRCILFQIHYCRERLNWCKEYIAWDHQQWFRVIFSNESHFTLISDSATCYCGERGEHIMHNSMFLNIIGMTYETKR